MANEYWDKDMLPVTKSMDGGDSCAEAGTFNALDGRGIDLTRYLPDRGPVRHPDADKWYGRAGRFSRDQMIPLLCAFTLRFKEFADVRDRLFKLHRKNFFLFTWNKIRNHVYEDEQEHYAKSTPDVKWNPEPKMPDITGPEIWGLWIRVYNVWWMHPLLWLFDLETLFGSIQWNWRKDRVTRNHLLVVYTQVSFMPTPWAWLSWYITPSKDLIDRWEKHCEATGAPDTSPLFRKVYNR